MLKNLFQRIVSSNETSSEDINNTNDNDNKNNINDNNDKTKNNKINGSSGTMLGFVEEITFDSELENLNLSDNRIGDMGAENLSTKIGLMSLKSLNLSNCGITSRGMEPLCNSLSTKFVIESLTAFDFSGNCLRKSGATFIAKYLTRTINLTELNLSKTEIPIELILNAILENEHNLISKIKSINLSYCKYNKNISQTLIMFMSKAKSLEKLNLSYCKLDTEAFSSIFKGILENKTSSDPKSTLNLLLNLAGNNFSTISDKSIDKPVRCVKVLDLSESLRSKKALIECINVVKKIKQLHTLKIDRNVKHSFFKDRLFGDSLTDLCHSLPTLQYLSIRGTEEGFLAKSSMRSFLKSLENNKSLYRLDISTNRLSEEDIVVLTNSLSINENLRLLQIDKNKLPLKPLKSLLNCIKSSKLLVGQIPISDFKQVFNENKMTTDMLNLKLAFDETKNRFQSNKELLSSIEDSRFKNEYEYYTKYSRLSIAENLEVQKGKQFGVELIDIVGSTKVAGLSARVPTVLVKMSDALFANNGHLEKGIFRIAPDKSKAEELLNQLDANTFKDSSDVHSIANCIKVWFRRLPTKIIDENFYNVLENVGTKKLSLSTQSLKNKNKSESTLKKEIKEKNKEIESLLNELDEPQKSVFVWVLMLLKRVAKFKEKNKMNAKNLAIVFTPNLIEESLKENFNKSEKLCDFVEEAVESKINESDGDDNNIVGSI